MCLKLDMKFSECQKIKVIISRSLIYKGANGVNVTVIGV